MEAMQISTTATPDTHTQTQRQDAGEGGEHKPPNRHVIIVCLNKTYSPLGLGFGDESLITTRLPHSGTTAEQSWLAGVEGAVLPTIDTSECIVKVGAGLRGLKDLVGKY